MANRVWGMTLKYGTDLPTVCTPPQVFQMKDAPPGQKLWICEPSGWTAIDNPFGDVIDAADMAQVIIPPLSADWQFCGRCDSPVPFLLFAFAAFCISCFVLVRQRREGE